MSHNLKINGIEYSAVDKLLIPNTDGDEIEFIVPSGTVTITENGTHDVTSFTDTLVSVKDSEHFAYGYKTMTANASFEVTGIVDQQGNTFTPKGYAFMIASDITENTNITNSTNSLIYCFYDTENSIMRRTIMYSGSYTIRENPGVSSGKVGSGTFCQTASSSSLYNCSGRRYFWICWG